MKTLNLSHSDVNQESETIYFGNMVITPEPNEEIGPYWIIDDYDYADTPAGDESPQNYDVLEMHVIYRESDEGRNESFSEMIQNVSSKLNLELHMLIIDDEYYFSFNEEDKETFELELANICFEINRQRLIERIKNRDFEGPEITFLKSVDENITYCWNKEGNEGEEYTDEYVDDYINRENFDYDNLHLKTL